MKEPIVSIIIPTYGRPKMLSRAINSVLNQTYKSIEIIVVDDNDPDSSARIETELMMRQYEHNARIRYIQHPENLNGSAARNTGIKNSIGKYVAFLDDDDEFLENKIKLQVARLESLDETWGVCYTKFIRKRNNILFDRGIEAREGILTADILEGNFYISAGSNLLVRRSLIDNIGGFNENFLRRQDLEFLVRLSQITKIASVQETCLVIHMDDRANVIRDAEFYINNTTEYLALFSNYINALPTGQQKNITVGQYLGVVRFYLLKGQFYSAYRICKKHKIPFSTFIRYLLYLFKRRTFKLCYGFQV